MNRRDLEALGLPSRELVRLAQRLCAQAAQAGFKKSAIRAQVTDVVEQPEMHTGDPYFGELAQALLASGAQAFSERDRPAPWRQFGEDLDPVSIQQMENASRLPVSVVGALMPDAHVGYGLPIGGVLATENAVIPYAVGVDIACRMRLTVLDLPVHALSGMKDRLAKTLEQETRFGLGAKFRDPHDHPVMDLDWDATQVTRGLKEKARGQLGTSGTGNHFVEFGELTLERDELGLKAGTYLALLSHSGSRGPGAQVCSFYSKLAMKRHPELPKELRHLAWLDMDSADGQEYWAAMQLMGAFAAANHEIIHRQIVRALRAKALAEVENHHNFAWEEDHSGRRVIVHRKGATPAGHGVLGVIPGSMATPAFVVRGKGNEESLQSASHGAGRVMSRKQAKRTFTWSEVRSLLEERGITVLSADLDESPGVYKDIHTVMDQQRELVEILARFDPRIVKMAPPGERPED